MVEKADVRFALRRAAMTLAVGLAIALALLMPKVLIPATFFMTVEDLAICPAGTVSDKCPGLDHHAVRQQRHPRWPMRLGWAATIYRVAPFPMDEGRHVEIHDAVCHGSGSFIYRPRTVAVYMDVDVWVGNYCELRPGVRYMPYAQWTYDFLLWSWTVEKWGDPVLVQ